MDLWKWILVAVAALAAALFFLLPSGAPTPGSEERGAHVAVEGGELVLQGAYTLRQGDNVVGEETFKLWRTPAGEVLSSTVELDVQNTAISMHQTLRFAGSQPRNYDLDVEVPGGTQRVTAAFSADEVVLSLSAGPTDRQQTLTPDSPVFVLDNNVISHYVWLYRQLRAGDDAARQAGTDLVLSGSALVPQAMTALPLRVQAPVAVTLQAPGRAELVPARRYTLQFGDQQIRLYAQGDTVFGVEFAAQDALAYHSDLFPDGFSASEETPASTTLPAGVVERDVSFDSGAVTLAGTLARPADDGGPYPAVLMLHGSGPVDRDENAPGLALNVFRELAHRLARAGAASLRYDKRGVGQSGGDFAKAGMHDLLDDARAGLDWLKSRPEVDPARVYVLGHSEGGILAPILAAEGGLDGIVVISGAAVHPLDWIILEQTQLIRQASDTPPEQIERELEQTRAFIEFVKGSEGDWEDFSYEQIKQRLPSMTEASFEANKASISLTWYRQHFAHDPAATLGQVDVPVLIVQGEKDLQVPPAEAERMHDALEEAGNGAVTLHLLPDLNHLLRHHPEAPNMRYRHVDEPVDPRVLELVAGWVRERAGL